MFWSPQLKKISWGELICLQLVKINKARGQNLSAIAKLRPASNYVSCRLDCPGWNSELKAAEVLPDGVCGTAKAAKERTHLLLIAHLWTIH